MKNFLNEFKEFIMRGNVLDMAVGVVVGGAFTAIVTSIVENLLTPIIGLFMKTVLQGANFADWTVAGFGVGAVINAIIVFLFTAFVVFLIVKAVNKAQSLGKKEEEAPAEEEIAAPTEAELLAEIRDLLQKANEKAE